MRSLLPKYHQESECNYLLLLFGCLIYAAVLLLWYFGYGDTKFVFFGGISALITILNSYESEEKHASNSGKNRVYEHEAERVVATNKLNQKLNILD